MLLPGFGIGFWHCCSSGAPQAIGERKQYDSDPRSEHQTDDSRERAVVHKRRSQDGRYGDAPNYFDCQWCKSIAHDGLPLSRNSLRPEGQRRTSGEVPRWQVLVLGSVDVCGWDRLPFKTVHQTCGEVGSIALKFARCLVEGHCVRSLDEQKVRYVVGCQTFSDPAVAATAEAASSRPRLVVILRSFATNPAWMCMPT
jgi:hypothetical protein